MPEPWEKADVYIKAKVIALYDGTITHPDKMSIQTFYTISIDHNPYKSKETPYYEIKLWESPEQLEPYIFSVKELNIYTS